MGVKTGTWLIDGFGVMAVSDFRERLWRSQEILLGTIRKGNAIFQCSRF